MCIRDRAQGELDGRMICMDSILSNSSLATRSLSANRGRDLANTGGPVVGTELWNGDCWVFAQNFRVAHALNASDGRLLPMTPTRTNYLAVDNSTTCQAQAVLAHIYKDRVLPKEVSSRNWLSYSSYPEGVSSRKAWQMKVESFGAEGVNECAIGRT